MPLLFCGGRHAGPQPDVSEEPSKKAEDEGTGGHAAVPEGVRQAERREILMRTVPGVMKSFYKVTQHSSTSFTVIFPILVLIQYVRIDQSNIFVYLEIKVLNITIMKMKKMRTLETRSINTFSTRTKMLRAFKASFLSLLLRNNIKI